MMAENMTVVCVAVVGAISAYPSGLLVFEMQYAAMTGETMIYFSRRY